jgi:hypothetical protein
LLTRLINNVELGRDNRQQLVFDNFSDRPYSGLYTAAPWFGYEYREFTLQDTSGETIPYQMIRSEAAVNRKRIVLPLSLAPGERKIVYLNQDIPYTNDKELSAELAVAIDWVCKHISFQLMADDSDTWTHALKRYTGEVKYFWQPESSQFMIAENGPLCISARAAWDCPACNIVLSVVKHADDAAVRLGIKVGYHGRQELLKMNYKPEKSVKSYLAGCPGSQFERELDGRELPLHDFVQLDSTAFVSRDIYAIDSPGEDSDCFRLTLLRSPFYANHGPFTVASTDDYPLTEQGEYFFNCTIIPDADAEKINAEIICQSEVIMFSESTRGCNRTYMADIIQEQ